MPQNANDPNDWNTILPLLAKGDIPAAQEMIVARERKLDSYVSVITLEQYQPALTQGVAVTYNVSTPNTSWIEMYRTGPWVQVNIALKVTSAGTAANPILITLPRDLTPRDNPSAVWPTKGTFSVYDVSTQIHYTGKATSTPGSPNDIGGMASGGTDYLGVSIFTAALASGDAVSLSYQYLLNQY